MATTIRSRYVYPGDVVMCAKSKFSFNYRFPTEEYAAQYHKLNGSPFTALHPALVIHRSERKEASGSGNAWFDITLLYADGTLYADVVVLDCEWMLKQ